MRKRLVMLVLTSLLISITAIPVSAGRWGIGLGNPYISLKYWTSPRFAIEGRGAFGSGIGVYSVRLYRGFGPKGKTVTFAGVEVGLINFDKEDIEGDGSFGMLFLGFERFISKKMAFSLDIGPAYISLSSEDTSVGGIEWVYNLGINFYFK
ncbi:hypothetical protein CEE45_16910 [Candidatus Heimdallarchaeota archaeon B3_Heim]|nr:MAG: hypothetical protein CEE45_16910 [Candidatus Heimdallarchaeota archaeon B3_Heim]